MRSMTLLALLFFAFSAFAQDVYLLRYRLPAAPTADCANPIWADRILFSNESHSLRAFVQLVETTYSLPAHTRKDLEIGPGVGTIEDAGGNWDSDQEFWIGIARVRTGTLIKVHSQSTLSCAGKLVAVFPQRTNSGFTPPQFRQFHVGVETGMEPSRTNVTLYNGGDLPAGAFVSVRYSCGGATGREVSVPPRSIVTVSGLHIEGAPCGTRSAEVLANQPIMSWATTLTDTPELTRIGAVSN